MQFPKLKRNHIANFIGFLLVLLAVSVACIGYITYKNLSNIVVQLKTDTNPNNNLILYKEIMVTLSAMENKVESFQLSDDPLHLQRYNESVQRVSTFLDSLNTLNPGDAELLTLNDSLTSLINQKTDILNNLITLSSYQEPLNLSGIDEKIAAIPKPQVPDTATAQPATTQPAEKKNLLKRIFGRKNTEESTTAQPEVNTDSIIAAQATAYQQEIARELEKAQQDALEASLIYKRREMELESQHAQIQSSIMDLISFLESRETVKIKISSLNARELASRTNQQILIFSALTLILLVTTTFVIFSYTQKNKKYQKLLQSSKNSAEQLAKAKERFFANMSHEIRTPMNAISGFTKILLKSDLKNEQREQVDIINKSSEHLLKLLNDILDFSKLQADKLQLEETVFSPKELCHEVCMLLEDNAKEKNLSLLEEYGELPQYIKGDPYRLKQILLNLLSNGVKYTESGFVKLHVSSQKSKGLTKLKFVVTDSGKGISKDHQSKIFKEFEQSDASSFSKGTGLGLAITKRLVQLHKGTINLKSTEGKGTTVTVGIAYNISTEAPKPKESYIYHDKLKGSKILVADDEPFNVKLLTTLLDKHHIQYDEAYNGADALELARKNTYDAALLDLKMPKMSGWEVVKTIRSEDGPNKEIPILALTATITKIDQEKSEAYGFDHIIRKPFDEKELFDLLINYSTNDNNSQQPGVTVTSPAPHEPEVEIDLTSLFAMGDQEFVDDMIETFVKSAEEGWQKVESAVASQDFEEAAITAHRIVAPARHFKAQKLVKLLKALEKRADEQDPQLSPDDLPPIKKELHAVISALRAKQKDLLSH
ncbi:ATP-binding protein [Marinoscillum furvescens]|uniref:histidine kinase n=1 Tax=Marinoscillum furvescens DSM 4134 TaxID=1122208 RepID=A0A3D9KY66_MARFU|nr:ATP-binding protein [Marinoscillum furvescens]RED91906.1 Hpt domain-containing protein [Marinoscillum furvescens DSM 4134]